MDRELLALIVSFVAMVIVAASYFTKKKLHYLSLQLLGILFLIMSYFFTEQFFAMVGIAIGGLRTVTFFLYENKEKYLYPGFEEKLCKVVFHLLKNQFSY
jgi:hypothetical protein